MSIFLAYASEDQKWTRELASRLARKGLEVWDADSRLAPGDNWSLQIGKALEAAQAMIVLVSPAAAKSADLVREVEYALVERRFANRLIPVIVKPTRKLPWILDRLNPEKGSPSEVAERIIERLSATEAHPA